MIFETIANKCSHEKVLSKYFKAGCYHDGTVEFASPLLLIGFTNRCGSNLLGGYMRALDGIGGFQEQLNHDAVKNLSSKQGLRTFPDYIRHVSKGARQYGFKASVEQVGMLYRFGIARMYPSVRVLHVVRNNTLAQAVSFSIADQTKQWTIRQKKVADARYDRKDISRRLDWISSQNQAMRLAAQVFNFSYETITYEDLVANPQQAITKAGAFFGAPPPATVPVPALTRQADEINDAFIGRYLADIWRR